MDTFRRVLEGFILRLRGYFWKIASEFQGVSGSLFGVPEALIRLRDFQEEFKVAEGFSRCYCLFFREVLEDCRAFDDIQECFRGVYTFFFRNGVSERFQAVSRRFEVF